MGLALLALTPGARAQEAPQEPPSEAPVPSPDPDPPSPEVEPAAGDEPEQDDAASSDEADEDAEVDPDEGQASPAPQDPDKAKARDAFLKGIEQAKKARWSEALASFELSAEYRPLAVTTYNIGASLRALGRYVMAKKAFVRALAQDKADKFGRLSDRLREDTKGFIGEIDRLLARVTVTLNPPTAAIAVDGRPLELAESGDVPVMLAGTLPPGKGMTPATGTFEVHMNPGAHVFTLTRRGYADAVVNKSFKAGEVADLALAIDKLPGVLNISATEDRAIVTVDGRDVGQTPVELSRHEGKYKVKVFKDGFVPYETTVALDPGQRMNLQADLSVQEPALYEEWWFWTAIGAGVTAAAVTTYFLARPEPERPDPNCGGLNWCIEVPGS